MTLPAKFRKIMKWYGLAEPADWTAITPGDVLLVPSVGPSTLDKVRVYLAYRNLSLRQDQSPDYWLGKLDLQTDDPEEAGCPFTVLIDVNETYPFTFSSIVDADGRPVDVQTETVALWSQGMGDYSIKGMEADIQIERKGDDLPSSLAQRRENFEAEIGRMNAHCEYAAIVVEHSFRDFCQTHIGHGASVKSTARTWLSWMIRYPNVHWVWCNGRAEAEQVTFWLLERFYWHKQRSDARLRRDNKVLRDLREPV
jgi:hypothetical protein